MRILGTGLMLLASGLGASAATMPPPAYAEMHYPHEIRVHFLPYTELNETCEYETGLNATFRGCAVPWPQACDIYILQELSPTDRDMVQAHETAHCKGWPADHPMD